jgi:hypothetical protein
MELDAQTDDVPNANIRRIKGIQPAGLSKGGSMIAACRQCGKLVEMTTEEAYTPVWNCQWWDRICATCYRKHFNQDGIKDDA